MFLEQAMPAKRIIPCLDIASGRVVKGVRFVELRDAGDPVECARAYEKQGADGPPADSPFRAAGAIEVERRIDP